jgi:uncharacterized Tic20 family protein
MTETDARTERTYAMLCHLTSLVMFVGVPFGNIIGPLIIWLIKKDEYPLVDEHGKESLNFQISMTIYMMVSGLLIIVVIGLILLPALLIAELILVIMAAVKVSDGEKYQYPFTIRFLR